MTVRLHAHVSLLPESVPGTQMSPAANKRSSNAEVFKTLTVNTFQEQDIGWTLSPNSPTCEQDAAV